jgi:hypothetical protein
MLERDMNVDALEEPRHQRDLESKFLALPDERDEEPVRGRAEAEHDVLGAGLTGDLGHVGRRTHNRRDAPRHLVVRKRVGIEVADRVQAEVGLGQQAPFDAGAHLARAHDQGRLCRKACNPRATVCPAHQQPPRAQIHRPEHPRPADQRGRLTVAVEEGAPSTALAVPSPTISASVHRRSSDRPRP